MNSWTYGEVQKNKNKIFAHCTPTDASKSFTSNMGHSQKSTNILARKKREDVRTDDLFRFHFV